MAFHPVPENWVAIPNEPAELLYGGDGDFLTFSDDPEDVIVFGESGSGCCCGEGCFSVPSGTLTCEVVAVNGGIGSPLVGLSTTAITVIPSPGAPNIITADFGTYLFLTCAGIGQMRLFCTGDDGMGACYPLQTYVGDCDFDVSAGIGGSGHCHVGSPAACFSFLHVPTVISYIPSPFEFIFELPADIIFDSTGTCDCPTLGFGATNTIRFKLS